MFTKNRYYFILFPLAVLLSGCFGTKHLKENERLLFTQRVKAPKELSKNDLEELYAQKANRRLPIIKLAPLISIHYLGKQYYDPKKFEKKIAKAEKKFDAKIAKAKSDRKVNNLQFRKQGKIAKFNDRLLNGNQFMQWGEPIAVYDSSKEALTIEQFKAYLFSNGYFQNQVTSKVNAIGKKRVTIQYRINISKPYTLDTIFYKVQDSTINALLLANNQESLLIKGEPYIQDNLTKERERIDLVLKDNGYYDFSRQYIEFNIDTTMRGDKKVAVQIIINDPAKRSKHKKFYIEEINFITDAGVSAISPHRTSQKYRSINYQYYEFNYSLKILSQRVFLTPGAEYNRKSTFDTQRQLANLNNFKFVNINYDTADGHFIANIYTSALDRYQWSNEVGLSITQGFPGPFYNLNFLKRNIFKGLENFEMNGRIGYEGVAAATSADVYQSIEAGVNASITFPQFLLPLSEETRYKLGRVNPRTRIQAGYNYTDRPEYVRKATSLNYTYSWENQRIRRFDLTVASLSVINSDTDPTFQEFLERQYDSLGNTLIYTFRPSFVSSIIFAMTWNHNNYGSPNESSAFIRWAIESGGTMQNFIDFRFLENRSLQAFKYIRASVDLRRINVINKNTTVAYRLNAGAAYSYDSEDVLPYEKYFFAGGSNSVRAWRPRRLGPGSFKPPVSSDIEKDGYFNYQFEQPGDIIVESSIELRKKLFGFVEGAVFLDAGNTWTFKPREKRDETGELVENGNSKFKLKQFYKELGIGTGFGLRFNFSFLILRFDVGMKVYDPARDEGDRFMLRDAKFFKPFAVDKEPVIYNIGIGYPF